MDAKQFFSNYLVVSEIALALGFTGFFLYLVRLAVASRRPKGFPPGPTGLPVLGAFIRVLLRWLLINYAQETCIRSLRQSLLSSKEADDV
jgi:hypothetical protein